MTHMKEGHSIDGPDGVRPGPIRWAEIWLASIMAVHGAVLLGPGETFSLPSYRIVREFMPEDAAGALALAFGTARLFALWPGGGRPGSPPVRLAGCSAGFMLYGGLTMGFLLAAPPISTGMIHGVLALAELHASGRAARDLCPPDGLRAGEGRCARERLAARD